MEKTVEVKPRWGRRLGIAFGVFVLLLVVLYFVATSAAFLKAVILPRVGKSLNADITIADASISPFSQVVLKDFRLKTTGDEPLVSANEVRLRYSLMDIIKGHINVDEATLDGATVSIVKEADGSSNLDPLLKSEKKKETAPSDKKTDLNIKNVSLKNSAVRITQKLKEGGPNTTELTALNLTIDQLKTGGSGKLTIASDLQMRNRPTTNSNDVLLAKINGTYDFSLSPDLAPQSIKGSTKIQVTQAQGAFKEAVNLTASLDAEATPSNVNQLAFRFEKAGQQLGQLRVHGPFDLAKTEGVLTVELLSLDRNILNIAGAGMDFGNSTINSTNRIEVTRQATAVAVEGRLTGKQLGVVREQKPTPPVDLDFDYKLAADLSAKTAALDRILLTARHKNTPFLTASLDRPMNLSWGSSSAAVAESAFRLVVTNLNLTDWQAMLGTNPPSGIVNATLVALAQNDGRKLAFDLSAVVDQFGMTMASNTIRNAQIAFNSKGTVEEFNRIASLQQHLHGNANFNATNLHLQIVGPKLKRLLVPISLFLRVPELLETPINYVDAQTQLVPGKISIAKLDVASEAFFANVAGDIVIDKVLTNSLLNLPVNLSLRRSLAEKAWLLPDNTPANAKYAPLPKFVAIKGTLGAPEPEINKLAITGLLARGAGGLIGNRAGDALQDVGNILTGNTSTNATGTNANPAARLIQGLGGLLGGNKSASTNAATTNAPATNNPARNLLNIFKKAQ